jgi:hypothetical protein
MWCGDEVVGARPICSPAVSNVEPPMSNGGGDRVGAAALKP